MPSEIQLNAGSSIADIREYRRVQLERPLKRKIVVLELHQRDVEMLEDMLATAREKIPAMEFDSVCSTIITEVCNQRRQQNPENPVHPV